MEGLKNLKCVEDSVNYRLFPPVTELSSPQARLTFVEQSQQNYFLSMNSKLSFYIWQNEGLNLKISDDTHEVEAHLFGETKFSDNVEDEWFIVYLLLELTKEFPGLLVQINDNDGEFLLIEAADYLPKWLEPENAENRVWLYEGAIHIIPVPETPAQLSILPSGTQPSIATAIKCVRKHSELTRASPPIQKAIMAKISGFPERAKDLQHHTHCYIPASLAAILTESPDLVAPIVQAFYYRDPHDLKACVTFNHFRPGTRVMTNVRMTRCLYAQLTQQQFTADRRSGYTLPAPNHPQYAAHDLGTKLAHGVEILCSRCGPVSDSNQNNDPSPTDAKWTSFLKALTDNGYFKASLKGSHQYRQLLQEARRFYADSDSLQKRDTTSPGYRIRQLLQTVEYDVEEMRKKENDLPPADDDSWLTLSREELDDMLSAAYRQTSGKTDTGRAEPDLGQVANNMRAFVNKISSHEGAEFADEDDDTEVTFDPDSFIHNMQKMFDFKDEKDTSSEDELSEYGSDLDLDLDRDLDRRHTGDKMTELQEYMAQMDRELAATCIGESFVKQEPVAPPRRKKSNTKTTKNEISSQNKHSPEHYSTSSNSDKSENQSNQKAEKLANGHSRNAPQASIDEDIDDLDEDFAAVDVDVNLVRGLLESHAAQQGLAGPASNLLGRMGVRLPADDGTAAE